MQTRLSLKTAYKLRLHRRLLLFWAFRRRHQLRVVADKTEKIHKDTILGFSTVRNEILRLPFFLQHYRKLGVEHFLIVDNDSDDGTRAYLEAQDDVSVWGTGHSYRRSRFGMDWLMWLQIRYGHGHWCLTVDADEILVYPHHDDVGLRGLTQWLDGKGLQSFGTLMLDLYPKGPIGDQAYTAGQDPSEVLNWFDVEDYREKMQLKSYYLSVQGGVRERMFFKDNPAHAPHLNKIPLVKWNRRFAYVSSTHALLPPRLNRVFETTPVDRPTGILLHNKFLNIVLEKSQEDLHRKQHFTYTERYETYYDAVTANPDMWCDKSVRYRDWQQLVDLGLMSLGDWHP